MSEIAMPVAVIHDPVGKVFCDPRDLGEFLGGGGIEINCVGHVIWVRCETLLEGVSRSDGSQSIGRLSTAGKRPARGGIK